MCLCCGGCATFRHQAGRTEPHAVLEFESEEGESGEYCRVISVNGLPLRAWSGARHRVPPGEHVVVYRDVMSRESAAGLFGEGENDGTAPPSAARAPVAITTTPYGVTVSDPVAVMRWAGPEPRPVRFRRMVYSVAYITNTVSVEAGRHYIVDRCGVRKETARDPGSE